MALGYVIFFIITFILAIFVFFVLGVIYGRGYNTGDMVVFLDEENDCLAYRFDLNCPAEDIRQKTRLSFKVINLYDGRKKK